MECLSFCISDKINLHEVEATLKKTTSYKVERFRDILHVHEPLKLREYFLFKNGTLVTWGFKRYQVRMLIANFPIADLFPINDMPYDEFSYKFKNKLDMYPDDYFNVDRICLDEDDVFVKLAISYGLSISIKLNLYEEKLEQLINKHRPILELCHKKGGLKISRNAISKILTEIIATKSKINLSSDLLYQPKFFWRHPNLEEYYNIAAKYLDIKMRLQTINLQLESLNETFELFNSYLINKHSHYLEIIIVALIAIEIIFNVLNLHLN